MGYYMVKKQETMYLESFRELKRIALNIIKITLQIMTQIGNLKNIILLMVYQ